LEPLRCSAQRAPRRIFRVAAPKSFARYIGAPVEALKRVRQGDVRYVRAGCAMTMVYNTGRLTVIYDPKTERIKRLDCN